MHTGTCICTHIHTYMCKQTYSAGTYTCTYIHNTHNIHTQKYVTYTHTHVCRITCLNILMCIRTYIHTCTYIYAYTHIHKYKHTCGHTYKHTHGHTHKHTLGHTYKHTLGHTYKHTLGCTYKHTMLAHTRAQIQCMCPNSCWQLQDSKTSNQSQQARHWSKFPTRTQVAPGPYASSLKGQHTPPQWKHRERYCFHQWGQHFF